MKHSTSWENDSGLVDILGSRITVDERLQFLLQSTESLHSNVHELSASVAELRGSMNELRGSVADLTRVVEIDADNIRRLANIAAAHNGDLDDLKTKLERLERRGREG